MAPGEAVEIGEFTVPDGMLYVGSGLQSLRGWGGAEPALIDPAFPVGPQGDATASYWPSYSQVSPAFRRAYLRWLAGGRREPGVDTGCVFLFFYGIERRVLHDAERSPEARAELPALVAAVEALLATYPDSSSLQSYASAFLEFVRARHWPEQLLAEPPTERTTYELPLSLRVGLGRRVRDREPIPAEWALAWLRLHPEAYLRTPAIRCREEFDELFRLRYRERYGEGMTLKPNRTWIRASYRPASNSFGRTFEIRFDDLPDVAALTAPLKRLRTIAEQVTEELDRYSRCLGRNDEDRDAPAALALLPPELLADRVRGTDLPLLAHLDAALGTGEAARVDVDALVGLWPSKQADRLAKKEAEALASFLEKLGYGLAPDVRHSGINVSQTERAVVYRLPAGEVTPPSEDFGRAVLLLGLAVAVAGSDELAQAEEEEIERHLESAYRLGAIDQVRLRAHLAWLRACPPSVTRLKRQVKEIPAEQRAAVGRALIAVAGADGHVSPAEIKMLTRVYPLLGLDADTVYADIHALAAGGTDRASGPVPVLARDDVEEFAIPRPAEPAAKSVVLDAARVAAIRSETKEVTHVLAGIFTDEEEAPGGAAEPGGEPSDASDSAIPGLDAAHAALVHALGERAALPYAEFEALAEQHGLLAGGAVEIINEAAFACCDEPLLEGHDPLEVNPYAREEMLA